MVNSEKALKTWFIENPISKDLVKTLTLRIAADCEKDFIMVMKSPDNRVQMNLTSFLTIRLANTTSRRQLFEKRLQPVTNETEGPEDIEIETREHTFNESDIRVMLIGRLENPRIVCLKSLHHAETDSNVVPLGVRKNIA
jgi:hypothetical protein